MIKKSFFALLMLGALACGNNQETSTETKQEVMQQHEAVEAIIDRLRLIGNSGD